MCATGSTLPKGESLCKCAKIQLAPALALGLRRQKKSEMLSFETAPSAVFGRPHGLYCPILDSLGMIMSLSLAIQRLRVIGQTCLTTRAKPS